MLVDLSVPLNERTPVYPGDPQTTIRSNGILAKDGYEDHFVCVGTHVGTHIDAPRHMIEGGKTLDQIPIEQFSGRGVYVKVEGVFDLDKVKKAPIQAGDIVVFHTNMSDLYDQSEYHESYPVITEDIARDLAGKNIKMIGVDMCSPDKEPFPVHKILLGSEILIIENLTNLGTLAGKEFKIFAFPIKLTLDGAPARVIAELS